jgi:hypothetical protein
MNRSVGRLRVFLAFAAAIFSAAAPVFAHAHFAHGAQAGYAEVCTERGLARVATGDGPQGHGDAGAALAHCALCVPPGGDPAFAGAAPVTRVVHLVASPIVVTADRGVSVDPVRAPRPRGPPTAPGAIA